jgi:peptidoglycan/LPS O-acetylase OafA/YrhL
MAMYGTSIHLWYLPFGMVVTIFVRLAVLKGFLNPDRKTGSWCIVLASLLIAICSWLLSTMRFIVPFSQWFFILPAIAIGLVFSTIPLGKRSSLPYLLCTLVVLAGACMFTKVMISADLFVPYIVGISCCIIAWAIPGRINPISTRLAKLSFGVYLIHPLIISLLPKIGFASEGSLFVGLVCLLALLLTWGLQLTPLRVFA